MEIKKSQKSRKIYECKICNYISSRKWDFDKHNLSAKHIKTLNAGNLEINGNDKFPIKYECKVCKYITWHKSDFTKHNATRRHLNMSLNDNPFNDNIQIVAENKCNHCDKEFSTLSGLWKHRKTCSIEHQVPSESHTLNKGAKLTVGSSDIPIELILEVIKQSKEVQNVLIEQNKELQKQLLEHSNKLLENENRLLEKDNQLIEQNKQILEIAKKPNMINSNNKTSFNLQFFLNETCKDAMNIVDFVNSLQLTNNDFETTGKLGFVNGISRIFINNLKKMDVIRRPLHCTDVKRETVYIKDNDAWEKETDEKKKLNWVVNRIAQLNLNQIQQWQQEYPDSVKNNTPDNEKFTELALVALGGRGEDEIVKFNDKIMKNVLKEVILSRSGEP
jgi:hypothetical protein